MNVKFKTVLISIMSFLLITILTFTVFSVVIFNYINKIEVRDLNNKFEVMKSLLNRAEADLNKTVNDWANWNDTYNFILGNNKQEFIEANLQDSTLKQLNLRFMFFTDAQGNIVYSITDTSETGLKDLLAI